MNFHQVQKAQADLKLNGFCQTSFNFKLLIEIRETLNQWIIDRKWNELDSFMGKECLPGGELFSFFQHFLKFDQPIEYFLSLREGDPEEEDGIWHDDGSRQLAFSLSLTLNEKMIQGGHLCFRQKGQNDFHVIPTPAFGEMIIFLTGLENYEHRILKVQKGQRLMLVGWCS